MILQQCRQGRAFHASKRRFTGCGKDFRNALLLTLLDHVVKIKKIAAQTFCQSASDGCFTSAHEPDEDHASLCVCSPGHKSFLLSALRYCFFTRILPLKDWSSTEDEPELEVPAKERPCLGTKELWLFSCKGKAFSTVPLVERAARSTEAVVGRVTSIAPVCVVRM